MKVILEDKGIQELCRRISRELSALVWNRTLDVISWLSSVGDLDNLKKKKG